MFFFRYTGFYNDPNYLCTTLIVFLTLVLCEFSRIDNKYIKVGLIVEILIIVFLVTTTVSRTGLLCVIVMLAISMWGYLKKHTIPSVIVVSLAIGSFVYTNPKLVENTIESYTTRADR